MAKLTLPESTSTSITDFPVIEGRVTADKVNQSFQTYTELFEIYSKDLGEFKSKIAKLEDSQNRVIETIGIFAALLAFVAFEAQIFKGPLSTASLVGVSAIMFGALTFFVLLLDLAFDAFKQQRYLRYALFGLSTLCIIGGFLFARWGYLYTDNTEYLNEEEITEMFQAQEQTFEEKINEFEGKIESIESQDELLEFKNCILKQGLSRCL